MPPRFRLAAFDAANPSLPDTFNRPVANAAYPVLSNGGHSERVLLIPSRNVRSLLPGPFYDCWVPVYTPTPALCNLDRSYTLPVRCFILFTCACEKYTGLFVVCQAFFLVITHKWERQRSLGQQEPLAPVVLLMAAPPSLTLLSPNFSVITS